MAEKIKLNTIKAQIDFIDKIIESETGVNLKELAKKKQLKETAMYHLGVSIAKSISFDRYDGQLVLARGGNISATIH